MFILNVISTLFGHELRLKYGRWVTSEECLEWFLLSPCTVPAMPFPPSISTQPAQVVTSGHFMLARRKSVMS